MVYLSTLMQLLAQDIVVLVKLALILGERPSMANLGYQLGLSPSRVHDAIKRGKAARLLSERDEQVRMPNLQEFLIHGFKYAFPAQRGELTRGVPTSYAGPPLNALITQPDEPPPVWPFAEGNVRGVSLLPLHKNVPAVVLHDEPLYEMLALLDALRDGRARERALAEKEIQRRLGASA
jgi:hypothetical protein